MTPRFTGLALATFVGVLLYSPDAAGANTYVDVAPSLSKGVVYFTFKHPDPSKLSFRIQEKNVVVSINDKSSGINYSSSPSVNRMAGLGQAYPKKSKSGIDFIIPIPSNLTVTKIDSAKNYVIAFRSPGTTPREHGGGSKAVRSTRASGKKQSAENQNLTAASSVKTLNKFTKILPPSPKKTKPFSDSSLLEVKEILIKNLSLLQDIQNKKFDIPPKSRAVISQQISRLKRNDAPSRVSHADVRPCAVNLLYFLSNRETAPDDRVDGSVNVFDNKKLFDQSSADILGQNLANALFPEARSVLPGEDASPPRGKEEHLPPRPAGGPVGDGRPAVHTSSSAVPPFCDRHDAGLWEAVRRAASGQARQAVELAGTPSAERRLAEYPAPLRSALSLRLAEAAVEAGSLALAERLLKGNTDRRLDRDARAHARHLQGYLASRRNDHARAREIWIAGAREPGAGGMLAAVGLARSLLDERLPVPETLLRRLTALAFDWRGDAGEAKVVLTLARVHAAAGRPAAALETLAHALPRLMRDRRDPSAVLAAGADVLRGYYCDAPSKTSRVDSGFYWNYVAFAPESPVGDAIRLCYAATLEDQDLLELAAGVLRPVAESGRPSAKAAERRLATLALRLGKPREALALLRTAPTEAGPPDRARDIAAAEAYAALGRYGDALARLAPWTDAEASERKADYAWRAGSWAQAAAMSREAGRRAGVGGRADTTTFRTAAAAYMAGGSAEHAASYPAADDPARSGGAFITSLPSRGNLRGRALAVIEQAGRVADLADLTGIGDPRP